MDATKPTWAVVNAATTGLSPREHRIVEIAVVVLDEHGGPLGEAATLVDPAGDLGAAEEHGIRPDDVRGAPRFDELTGWLAQWLRGKVVVGHNLLFLTAFLDEEFRRAGVEMPHVPAICTMTHAPRYLPSLPGRTLEQCCAAAGVRIGEPRTALTDARAAAALFASFLAQRPVLPSPWEASIGRAQRIAWPDLPVRDFRVTLRPSSRPGAPAPRVERGPESTSDFVVDVVDHAPRQPDEPATVSAYLGALDTAVSDRVLSFTEAIHLKDLAGALAIFEAEQDAAHRAYLRTLAATAWADHVVTDDERADLVEVGRLLDIGEDEVREIIAQARPPAAGRSPAPAAATRATSRARGGGRAGGPGSDPTGEAAGRVRRRADRRGARDTVDVENARDAYDAVKGAVVAHDEEAFEAGWYTDPHGEHRLRWYDGVAWTEHTHQ